MKFKEKFPNVKVGESPTQFMTREEYNALPESHHKYRMDHYLRMSESGHCWVCKELTDWMEINFESPCCSEECDEIMWKEYKDACRVSDLKYGKSGGLNEDFFDCLV